MQDLRSEFKKMRGSAQILLHAAGASSFAYAIYYDLYEVLLELREKLRFFFMYVVAQKKIHI